MKAIILAALALAPLLHVHATPAPKRKYTTHQPLASYFPLGLATSNLVTE